MKYLDDIDIGETAELGRHTFTAEEIKAFATLYDPQPFHLDEEAAARSHFGRLAASGWHTAGVCMRQVVDFQRREREAEQARGEPSAQTGVSPGIRDLKWLKPVYAGDTITFATEVIEKRPVKSRAGWGLLFSRHTGTNQDGELVYSFIGAIFLQRRPE